MGASGTVHWAARADLIPWVEVLANGAVYTRISIPAPILSITALNMALLFI
jgi:hypothetical protein